MRFSIFLGAKELLDRKSKISDVTETIKGLNRRSAIAVSARVLNALAYDLLKEFRGDQGPLLEWLPEEARQSLEKMPREKGADYKIFHPLQQLTLVHLAARSAQPDQGGLDLATREGIERWAVACLQINDHIPKNAIVSYRAARNEKILQFATEILSLWELVNWSDPNRSLARLLYMIHEVPKLGEKYKSSADRILARFKEYLGLDFEDAFNLTAFLIYWWYGRSEQIPGDADVTLIDNAAFLGNTNISKGTFERYLQAMACTAEEIPGHFDELGVKTGKECFEEILPFRRRPLLRINPDRTSILCPQLLAEKGGIDLFWLLTRDFGGPKEPELWTDDFGHLLEGYVKAVMDALGDRLGGRYVPDVVWNLGKTATGQIDGLIHSGRFLAVLEVKGSFLKQRAKSRGTAKDLEDELRLKFVTGDKKKRKGLAQLARAIQWLGTQRTGGELQGIDLRQVEVILPVLIVAERALRLPSLSEWFDYELRAMLGGAPWKVGALAIYGLQDLETLEERTLAGQHTLLQALAQYDFAAPRAEKAVWEVFPPTRETHPRLGRVLDNWLNDVRARGVLKA